MNPKMGILLKVAATFAFTAMSACVKGMNGAIPVGEIIFCRSFFAFFPLCIWLSLSPRGSIAPFAKNIRGLLSGSCACLGGVFFGFLALVYLPLVNVTVSSYTAPLFTIMLAALVLRETVRIYRWSAALTGLAGVFITVWPDLQEFPAGETMAETELSAGIIFETALALAGALCAAFSAISIRRLNRIELPSRIVLVYTGTGLIVGFATISLGWKLPDVHQFMLLVGAGPMGYQSQGKRNEAHLLPYRP